MTLLRSEVVVTEGGISRPQNLGLASDQKRYRPVSAWLIYVNIRDGSIHDSKDGEVWPYLHVVVPAAVRGLHVKPVVELVDCVEALLGPDLPHALGAVGVLGGALGGHGGADVAVRAVQDAAAAKAVGAGRELEATDR